MINLHPTVCNLCGGKVVFTSNSKIYGKEYGSGRCYLCTKCGAFVGTHEPKPDVAYGILSNSQMREAKKKLHSIFDPYWQGKPNKNKLRSALYYWLGEQMGIPPEESHFGYFDLLMLERAYQIMQSVKHKKMTVSRRGKNGIRIIFK